MTQRLRSDRRILSVIIGLLVVVLGGGVLILATGPGRTPAVVAAAEPSRASVPASSGPAAPATRSPPVSSSPPPSSSASQSAPPLVYEDLSGVPTTAELAHRYPIAVMIDDSPAARQQAGLSFASIVWQAPAEGGIPRYMAVFQAGTPPRIGPVRSARPYFVRWAAEWKAVYLHPRRPPPLRAFLAGRQTLVLDVPGRAP